MQKYLLYALSFVLALVPRLRADETVSDGQPATFETAISNIVEAGGGTILVTAPITVVDDSLSTANPWLPSAAAILMRFLSSKAAV